MICRMSVGLQNLAFVACVNGNLYLILNVQCKIFQQRGAVFVQRSHCEVQFLVLAFVWFGPLSTWKMPCQYMPVLYSVNTTFGIESEEISQDFGRYLFSSYLHLVCSQSTARPQLLAISVQLDFNHSIFTDPIFTPPFFTRLISLTLTLPFSFHCTHPNIKKAILPGSSHDPTHRASFHYPFFINTF